MEGRGKSTKDLEPRCWATNRSEKMYRGKNQVLEKKGISANDVFFLKMTLREISRDIAGKRPQYGNLTSHVEWAALKGLIQKTTEGGGLQAQRGNVGEKLRREELRA